ncbi:MULTISPECIES: heme exporter protein CcmD [Alphaproteobacteria]|uniref:Heme exporter protein D n=2 Tax=Alphaproteobacteria TaxID=28211 RepID=A0A512HKD9_9HYPH|nr:MULTISPECIES: heme exporter protein CcmD [Alphaproteobacteria]GEO85880.1 heme exporter protein D [Ciceribacter naphthalenivorans]GLR21736.1 heme exporter protein D [Ciceribacter naphthalenivorans]GLT04592.1 heme exporter protein D [Sphingomonas psychrolutea]
MSHAFYIYLSYGVSGLIVLALIAWVWLDGRARQTELKALEAAGIRRRSAPPASGAGE